MAKNMTGVCTKSLYDLISSVDMSMHAAADDEGLGCEKPQFLRRKVRYRYGPSLNYAAPR
jgi:hypothetical protein